MELSSHFKDYLRQIINSDNISLRTKHYSINNVYLLQNKNICYKNCKVQILQSKSRKLKNTRGLNEQYLKSLSIVMSNCD